MGKLIATTPRPLSSWREPMKPKTIVLIVTLILTLAIANVVSHLHGPLSFVDAIFVFAAAYGLGAIAQFVVSKEREEAFVKAGALMKCPECPNEPVCSPDHVVAHLVVVHYPKAQSTKTEGGQ